MECFTRIFARKVISALCFFILLQYAESIDPFPQHSNASLTSKLQRGYSARRGDYPFTAWILTGKKTYHCGASVVDAEWILTAASCVQDRDLDAYTFVLGDYKVRKKGDGERRIAADEIILHPRYAEGVAENDVAMVHLSETVNVQAKGIQGIARVNSSQMDSIEANNRQCLLTGWGHKQSGKLNKKLQFLPVVMKDDSECADIDTFTAGNSLCFSGEPGAPCEADMGSPIACELTDDQWVQVAVTAAGTCSSSYHVATKVMSHETWMASVQARSFCGDPPLRANGKFFISGVNVPGDSAILICNDGFQRTVTSDQDALITCRPDGTWSTTLAACVPNSGDCRVIDLPFVANGQFTPVSGTTLAVLECDLNYKPSSTTGRFIECRTNGQWSSTSTTCISDTTPGSCNIPPSIANGKFTLVPGTTLAILECNQNYKPSSTTGRFIECDQTNGQWSSTSTRCILDTTPGDCPNPPSVSNGQFTPVSGTTLAVLECDLNYKPSSTTGRFIECQNGQWSSTNTGCIRDTTPGDCTYPPSIANGRFTLVPGTTLALLECNRGYSPSSTSGRFIECLNGLWSSTSTTCISDTTPGNCPNPPAVANGQFTPVSGTSLAVLECNQNYKPSSTTGRFIECQNGQWSSTNTGCIRDTTPGDCPNPPPVANGQFTPIPGTTLAVLECDLNFKPSSTTGRFIECQTNGQWSSTNTGCIRDTTPGNCPNPPFIANGQFTLVSGTTLAVLECNQNYKPSSTTGRFIECQTNGQWSSTSTRCILDTTPGNCPSPPTIANGRFTLVSGTTLAVLECNQNYKPSSTTGRFIECQTNGQWSSTSTRCILDTTPGDCRNPPAIANGRFTLVPGTSLALLECNHGFKPSSTAGRFIECQANGQWSSTNTRCIMDTQPGNCGNPPFIANGIFMLVPGSTLAKLECNQNYKPSSTTGRFIECQSNGQWSSTSTICILDSTRGGCGSTGYSFMAGFPKAYTGRSTPYLYTLTRSPTQVVVTVPYYSQSIPFYLVEAAFWYFDRRIVGHGSYEVATKGIQVQAGYPITVIMNQYEPGNGPAGDGTLLHPEICASTDHIVVTADQSVSTSYRPNVMITGTKGFTYVTLQLMNGRQKTATIGRYGTFYYSGQHLIGARVFANHPVIVLAGHQCANVPTANVGFCDYLLEQMPPIFSLQSTYILSYMKPRPKYFFRAIATQPNTAVTIRNTLGQVQASFNLNQYSNIWISVINSFTVSITATRPILVAQFGEGTQSDFLGYGDPSMVVHPGINQWETFYQLYLPNDFYNQHWVIITIRNSDNIGGLRLNYQFLSYSHVTSIFVPSEGNFDVLHVRLYNTVNTLSHVNNVRFGVMQYGFNNRVEYSWMAGRLL